VQVKGDHIPVTARTASDDEKPRLWKIVTEQWPNYDVYQTRTDRVIPLVVLSPR
jgi:deazaflavin-dependent oxidoreductase (nitroreductase family)